MAGEESWVSGERIGVLGGTFDPPHIGHLVAALEVRHALALDRVLLMVANEPWHKAAERRATPAVDRLAMVEAAADGLDGVEACDLEIQRGGPSFTFDTLSELRSLGPAELFLIVGGDVAGGLLEWHQADRLPGLADLVVVDRPGSEEPEVPEPWVAVRVRVPGLAVSSSDLRGRIRRGAPIAVQVPAGVVDLIERRALYR